MKKRLVCLTALLLVLAFCLQGCGLLAAVIGGVLEEFPGTAYERPDYSAGAVDYAD